jgi:hypothetical protein
MGATSWQNLLTWETFVPDEALRLEQGEVPGLGPTLRAHIQEQAELLKTRLGISSGTALKLAVFWQPTALKKAASLLFQLGDEKKLDATPASPPLSATWLNRQMSAKELLKIAHGYPNLLEEEDGEPVSKKTDSFFAIVRNDIAFHGMVGHELYLLAEHAKKRTTDFDFIGDVALGVGSIQPDSRGGFMLAKYGNQSHGYLKSLSRNSAYEVAEAFGMPMPGGVFDWNPGGFYGSRAALGLALWFARHPRKAADLTSAANLYMGTWHEQAMRRLEFELVHAGILD